VSGIAEELPFLLTKENANLNSSLGEFLLKSTCGLVKCIWFDPALIIKWLTFINPPEEYKPVAEFATVKVVDVGTDATVTPERLYAPGLTPVTVTLSLTERVWGSAVV
jgi:hypothetical protein